MEYSKSHYKDQMHSSGASAVCSGIRLCLVVGATVIIWLVAIAGLIIIKGGNSPGPTRAPHMVEEATLDQNQIRDQLVPTLPPPPTVKRPSKPVTRQTTPFVKPIGKTTRAKPMPINMLVCTVNGEGPSLETTWPPRGVCDITFFDSMYKDVREDVEHAFAQNKEAFLNWPAHHPHVEFGVSYSLWDHRLAKDILLSRFQNVTTHLYRKGIRHVAVININRESVTPNDFVTALKALKIAYGTLTAFRSDRPSYAVLGAAIDDPSYYGLVRLMKEHFVPSLFIAITHISYDDRHRADCRIFPPTWLSVPARLSSEKFTYGSSLLQGCKVLSEVSRAGIEVPMALSFALSGRMYKPVFGDPEAPRSDEFYVFQPCEDSEGEYYVTPTKLCSRNTNLTENIKKLPQADVFFSFDRAARRTFTLDTMETLINKVCEAGNTCRHVPFGLAAFDVEYDAPRERCGRFGLVGPYGRAALLQRLHKLLTSLSSPGAFEKSKCLKVNINKRSIA